MDVSRRSFLQGSFNRDVPVVMRPPWADDAAVLEKCTSCGDCLKACPENILAADSRGRPVVELKGGECSFCGACAEACMEGVFATDVSPPWHWTVAIGSSCLLQQGVTCQLCTDFCAHSALQFNMRARPAGAVVVDEEACSGCGACLAACPTQALSLVCRSQEEGVV